MDAERDQAGAARGQDQERDRGLRCPECGCAANYDTAYRKQGFWTDPVRWMPAMLLALLVGFQFATPLVLPDRVETVYTTATTIPANDPFQYPQHPAWFGRTVTWEEIELAAKGSAREVEMMAPFLDQITTADHYLTWKGIDPAARVVLADGWIADNSDRGYRHEPWLWLGLFDTWLHGQEVHGFPAPTSGNWHTVYLPLPGNAPGFRYLRIDHAMLAFTVAQAALVVCCLRLLARPRRRGFLRPWFRSPWVWLTIAASITLAAMPTRMGPNADRVQSNSQQPSSFTPWQSTSITIEKLRTLATGPEPAVAVARAIVEARSRRTQAEADRPAWSNPGQWVACIGAARQTQVTTTSVTIGWPDAFAQLGTREKSTPQGAAATPGRFRIFEPSRHGFLASTNSGAWPGRSIWIQAYSAPLSFVLLLMLTIWWLFRALMRSQLFFRGRKRAARGLCVACGYDLQGLRRQPAPPTALTHPASAPPP